MQKDLCLSPLLQRSLLLAATLHAVVQGCRLSLRPSHVSLFSSVTILNTKDCRVARGSLALNRMSVDLPGSSDRYPAKSGIRTSPFGFLVPYLLQLYLDSSMASLPPLVHGFPCPNDTIGTSRFDISSLPGRQGFLLHTVTRLHRP